jgi:hypothetical protein
MKLQDYIIIIELHDITISYFYFVISDFLQKGSWRNEFSYIPKFLCAILILR